MSESEIECERVSERVSERERESKIEPVPRKFQELISVFPGQ